MLNLAINWRAPLSAALVLLVGCEIQVASTNETSAQPQPQASSTAKSSPAKKQTAKKQGPKNPATSANDAPRIKASNIVALRERLGKRIIVTGAIGRTAKSSSGHLFLNFERSQLTAVCFKEDVAKFGSPSPIDRYKGKSVEVSGVVELYKGKPQIKLRDPKQIKLASATAAPAAKSDFKLKQVGKLEWISPAGLCYRGRDPQGKTRVEHILRHAQDDPGRDGPHGVFEGGEAKVFALIDEAWMLAQKKRLKPRNEGRRSTYTIAMGRRIGYLGGKTGAARRKPALSRLFIVFETDTKSIVTAFPK